MAIPAAVTAAGILGGGSLASNIFGGIKGSSQAAKNRRQAQQYFDYALANQPVSLGFGYTPLTYSIPEPPKYITSGATAVPNPEWEKWNASGGKMTGPQQDPQTMELLNKLFSEAMTGYTPSFFNPELEEQKVGQVTADTKKYSDAVLAQLGEQQGARGLFRSGIGAQQSAQAATDINTGLAKAITDLRLGFQQQRSDEAARAYAFNQAALAAAINQANTAQGQQANIFNQFLGLAGSAAGGAGQSAQAANQAFGQVGSGLGQAGQMALLYAMLGQNNSSGKPVSPWANWG